MPPDALDELIARLQADQDRHPPTEDWWTPDLRKDMRKVYQRRQAALEELYRLRADRDRTWREMKERDR